MCPHQFVIADVDMPILGADFLLDHGMIVDMSSRKLDWIGGSLPLRIVADDLYCVVTENVQSHSMERRIAMAHTVNSDGEEVQQQGVCLVEPDRDFMDRTGVLVDPTTCSVPVQLAVMRETKLQKGTRLGVLCSVPAPETARDSETVRVAATGYENESNEREESEQFDFTWSTRKQLTVCQQHLLQSPLFLSRQCGPSDRGRTAVVTHSIQTGEAAPFRQAPRRLPHALRGEVNRQMEQMLKQGVIEGASVSPWSSPIVLVTKKDGTYRFGVDFRKLNASGVTIKDAYPIPRIDETLEYLGGVRYFNNGLSKWILASG